MRWMARLLFASLLALPVLAQSETLWPDGCTVDEKPGGEKTLVCKPEPAVWNGDLIVYAHGYVAPQEPLALPGDELTLDNGSLIPEILMGMGYAFATTSYSVNGYAVKEGADDMNALVDDFKSSAENAGLDHIFVAGGSEGGLIAAMLMEKHPDTYDGGLALCGPVGGMPYQIRYLEDFRVVFDYFFQDVFGFGAVEVPLDAWEDWDAIHKPAIESALTSDPHLVDQLFNVVGVARDPVEVAMESTVEASHDILAYNIKGLNDLTDKAGGNPYGNLWRWYRGSDNDWRLNLGVERVRADNRARSYLRNYYRPSGNLQNPLVTLHTTRDPIVPYRHELFYAARVFARGNAEHLVALPVFRYGHCSFTEEQVMGAFGVLVWMSTGALPSDFETYLETMQ